MNRVKFFLARFDLIKINSTRNSVWVDTKKKIQLKFGLFKIYEQFNTYCKRINFLGSQNICCKWTRDED
jgi:hypothetical protein